MRNGSQDRLPDTRGIGINTGNAQVGNTGSQHKFKYGPLGNTVILACRVQGATKKVKCDVIVTENTLYRLNDREGTRRLCRVEVINIPYPVDLYELVRDASEEWKVLSTTHEEAMDSFATHDYRKAVEQLGQLLIKNQDDGPTLILLSRVVSAMTTGPHEKHPVWVLDQK